MKKSQLISRAAPPAARKSFFGRLFSGFNLRTVDVWSLISGSAGSSVNTFQKGLQLSAVWRAVRLNAETIGSLPIHAYRWTNNGPVRVEDSETAILVSESPNAEQTAMEFWEGMQGSIELMGNAIAIKDKIGERTVALRMIDPTPGVCQITRLVTGDLLYRINMPDGTVKEYGPDSIFHIRGFSLGAVMGMSTIAAGASSLGLALDAQRSAENVFRKGLRASGFLKTNSVLKEGDRDKLQGILDGYMGSENAGGLMVLEAGMDFVKMGLNPIDAELLTTRKFQIEEIGRWFGTPPILLGHAVEGQTMWGSGVSAIMEAWLTLGLRQRLVRNQQAIGKRLRSPSEIRDRVYFRYNPDALLSMLSTQRVDVLTKSIAGSLMTPDEARAKQDMSPVPGGDRMLAPVNLAPLASLGENGTSETLRAALRDWLKPDPQEVR